MRERVRERERERVRERASPAVSPSDKRAETSRGGGDNQKRHCLGVVMSTVVVVPYEKKKNPLPDLFPFLSLSLSALFCLYLLRLPTCSGPALQRRLLVPPQD